MARRLRVPVKWLRAEAEAGRLPHVRADRAFLFDPDAVERVLLAHAQRMEIEPSDDPLMVLVHRAEAEVEGGAK
jgi:hypothetical protein